VASLARTLGLREATSIVVGGIIGSGIFVSPAIAAREAGAPGLALVVWIVAGIVATAGALCYAELAAAIPETGGTYVFLQRAYRAPLIAFLFGWAGFFASFPGPIAAVATAFAEYATVILAPIMPYGPLEKRILAVAVILALTAVNFVSAAGGGRLQNVATALKVLALAGVVFVGLLFGRPDLGRLGPLLPAGKSAAALIPAFGTALIPAFFAYNGWTYASYVGGELREPEKNLPRAILGGVGIVIVVYLAVNLTVLAVVPFDRLVGSTRPAADVLALAVGPAGGVAIAIAVMVSTLGAANAVLLSCSRSYFAMAKDGLFFRAFDRVHPRFGTPANAVLAQGVIAAIFAWSGSFEQILTYYAFLDFFFFTLAVLGVMILRRTEPGLARPFRVWGYPLTPLLFLGISVWYLANTLIHRTHDSLVGIGLTLSGLPFYWYWTRARRAPARSS
jgi:APA family basic amino acid/polyamine antiporter